MLHRFRLLSLLLILSLSEVVLADVDYALECHKGFRVSGIRRAKTHYSVLGSLTIECEQIALPEETTCSHQQNIPKCTGLLEGCTGDTFLGGFHAFLLENVTQALVLDPICCTAPSVTIDATGCIHDQLNNAKEDFSHSIVSDLLYRGVQCWHQYDQNRTLVDLLWKTEICPFESVAFPLIAIDTDCEECDCQCGIEQCANGVEPVRVIHKKRSGRCGCDCTCTYKCVDFSKSK